MVVSTRHNMQNGVFARYIWPVLCVPSILFYLLWSTGRWHAYTNVDDPNAHIEEFRQLLPQHNETQKIVDEVTAEIIHVAMQRRSHLSSHTAVSGIAGLCMILNLMPWVRTASYTLHRILGGIAVAGAAYTCGFVLYTYNIKGPIPLNRSIYASAYLVSAQMALCMYIGYTAAQARDWMRHRAAMMFLAAGMFYIPVNRFMTVWWSKAEIPWRIGSWAEHRDLITGPTSWLALALNNGLAYYFANYTVPRDKRVQAKLVNKTA